MIDFSISPAMLSAFIAGLGIPLLLAGLSRLALLQRRNALQFLLAAFTALLLWSVYLLAAGFFDFSLSREDVLVGIAILISMILLFLEAWALLSRGYTLGLLLTLLERGPLSVSQLASSYRSGDGLEWVMKHRLEGLSGAGLVRLCDGTIKLTAAGVPVVLLYRFCIRVFGLTKTG